MAFCKQCGADLNGANFCAGCGTPADGNVAVQQAAPAMDPRQASLAEMEKMVNYFGAKADVYRECDAVAAEVKERSERTFLGWIGAAVLCVIIGLFSKAIFFYIAAVPFVVGYVLKRKKNKEKLAVATAHYDKLSNELEQLFVNYGYCPIGQEYTHPDILGILYDLVRKGRATTPGDAVNRYLDDLDKEEQQRKLGEIAESTKQAAKTAKDARNVAVADFLFKR